LAHDFLERGIRIPQVTQAYAIQAVNEQFRDLLFPGGPAGAGQGWQHPAYLLIKAQHLCLTHFRAGGVPGMQCVFAPYVGWLNVEAVSTVLSTVLLQKTEAISLARKENRSRSEIPRSRTPI
jgi:hypothetical protein